jgi:hypothetical protein
MIIVYYLLLKKVHYDIRKSPLVIFILCQMNSAHNITKFYFKFKYTIHPSIQSVIYSICSLS